MGSKSIKPKANETRPQFLNRADNLDNAAAVWRKQNGFRFELVNSSGIELETFMPFTVNCGECEDQSEQINLFVTQDIENPWLMEDFVQVMRNNPQTPVDVEVNTRGGSVELAMGMFNAMAEHEGTVTARITGMAASSGLLLSQAADRVLINENAKIMMHPGMVVALMVVQGKTDAAKNEFEFAQEMADKGTEQIIDLLAIRSGQDRGEVENMVMAKGGNGTTLTATEAVEMGFADEVIAMVPRGEKQGVDNATKSAAWSVLRERELAEARKRRIALGAS